MTHIAAAHGRPTVGIYCDHEPGLAGLVGSGQVISLGGKGQRPSRNDVMSAVEQVLTSPVR
jgi:heptosyltransferase-1